MSVIATHIAAVRERIAAAARRAGRPEREIQLVGVTKTHPVEVIEQALAAGLSDFAENRVQEAEAKIRAPALQSSTITWHLIGHLQRNKAKRAAQLFDLIHSVDSLRLAEALDRYVAEVRAERDVTYSSVTAGLPVLLQVNVSGETTKEGFALSGWEQRPEVLDPFLADVERLLALPNLRVRGLMTIAPWGEEPEMARPAFVATRRLRDLLARRFPSGDWSELSMGMTDDFEVAIEEGATVVRVGRAIFGARSSARPA